MEPASQSSAASAEPSLQEGEVAAKRVCVRDPEAKSANYKPPPAGLEKSPGLPLVAKADAMGVAKRAGEEGRIVRVRSSDSSSVTSRRQLS